MLLVLVAVAHAGPVVPESVQGRYVDARVAASWFGDRLPEATTAGVDLRADTVVVDSGIEAVDLPVTGVASEGAALVLSTGEAAWRVTPGAPATLTRPDGVGLVRLADVVGDLGGPADVATAATWARGWSEGGTTWLVLPEIAEGRLTGRAERFTTGDPAWIAGRFDGGLRLDGGEWLATASPDRIVLAEADAGDGPDRRPRPGGRSRTLRRLDHPPLVALADALTVRASPGPRGERAGTLPNGQPLRAWGRTTDGWLLFDRDGRLAWTSEGYVARVTARREGWTEATPLTDPDLPLAWGRRGGRGECRAGPVVAGASGRPAADVRVVLTSLDGKGALDVVCAFDRRGAWDLCPILRTKDGALGLGCGEWPTAELPALEARDVDGDGYRDLLVGVGPAQRIVPFDPGRGVFYPGEPARPPAGSAAEPGCRCASSPGAAAAWLALVAAAWRRR